MLESLERAQSRCARIYGEVAGYGRNSDAYHITAPSPGGTGAAACMQQAIDDAGLAPSAIGHVNAHGTSTPVGDPGEVRVIRMVLGDDVAARTAVSSTKSMHGHAMGASGGLEAIAVVLALVECRIPPTANLDQVDPGLPELDFVPRVARKASVEHAMSSSFAFGGNNAVLVLRRV